MKISGKIKDYLFYYMIIYMLNKNLWDFLFGSLAKNVYYIVLFTCGVGGVVLFFLNKKTRKVALFFIFYSVVVILNGFFISNAEQRSVGFMEYLVYPLAFFALAFCMNSQNYKRVKKIIIYWGVFTSLLALVEYARKAPLLSTMENYTYHYVSGGKIIEAYRPFVFIGSPMVLAVLLGFSLILTIYSIEFEKRKNYRVFILVILLGIFATGSRAPLLSTAIGIVLMFLYKEKLGRGNRKLIIGSIVLISVLSLSIIVMILFPNFKTGISFIDTAFSRFASTLDFQNEWGNIERLARWGYYLGEFIKNPIKGYGIASTSAAVLSNVNITAHGVTTESGVIGRLVETGLIGAVPYYCMFFSAIKLSYRKLKKQAKSGESNLFFAFVAIISLFLIEDCVLQISLDIFSTFAIWLIISYMLSHVKYGMRTNIIPIIGCLIDKTKNDNRSKEIDTKQQCVSELNNATGM